MDNRNQAQFMIDPSYQVKLKKSINLAKLSESVDSSEHKLQTYLLLDPRMYLRLGSRLFLFRDIRSHCRY